MQLFSVVNIRIQKVNKSQRNSNLLTSLIKYSQIKKQDLQRVFFRNQKKEIRITINLI